MMLRWVYTATFRIIHFASLELSLLSSPTGPSTTHSTARKVSERATWSGTDWTLYPARGMCFAVGEGGAIG